MPHAIRRRPTTALLTLLLAAATACAPAATAPAPAQPTAARPAPAAPRTVPVTVPPEGVQSPPGPEHVVSEDTHSFARPMVARVTHTALDLKVDFARHVLSGTSTVTVDRAPGATDLVLDTRDLDIAAVTDEAGAPLEWSLGDPVATLGRPLRVTLPAAGPDTLRVVVRYTTSPGAAAVQWLEPSQTTGGKRPFMFTQGEPILTRTWIPTQDSPGIRQTYSARIVVPRGLKAVMSARMQTPDGIAAGDDVAYTFAMPQPIPAYLIALAVGDLAFREIGPRTGVYAEPGVVDTAAWEFADMEKMLEAAESLYGPYRWGRYDVLVLPPSFPYGGMENPRLTFATPTVLAGDRSLVSLVAHEMAHSWSGNLVTNATWNDFWLNEGFTDYFERRIDEALYGVERANMEWALGRRALRDAIEEIGPHDPDTRLRYDMAGRDPDDGFSDIPYEKGSAFLYTIEHVVGRERFDAFLRRYFDSHAFQVMTSTAFVEYLYANLIGDDRALAARIRPEEWVFEPGLPDNLPPLPDVFAGADSAARAFAAGASAASLPTGDWSTQQWLHFLSALPDTLPQARLQELDRAFGFTGSGNSEIRFAWMEHAIAAHYTPALDALRDFLTRQGRRKFVAPLYSELAQSAWGRAFARDVYTAARPLYHSVTRNTVDRILDWKATS